MKIWREIFLCLIYLSWLAGCNSTGQSQVARLDEVVIGMDASAAGALIHVAYSQGYFTDNDLDVAIKYYSSGLEAMEGALKGEVDAAVCSEFAMVGKIFTGEPVRSWASIDRFMHVYLIALSSGDIASATDLRGKKIGLPLKTSAEFYLGRLLELNGISLHEVTAVDIGTGDLADALQTGKVDAVVAWPPYTYQIEAQLGPGASFRWPIQSDQVGYGNLVSSARWVQEHPESIKLFLKALVQAEAYYASNEPDVRNLLKQRLAYDDALLASTLDEHQFQVSLDQSMILAMEDEARWMINNKVVTSKQTPHFIENLYLDGLLAVRPDSVSIIR